MTYYTTTSGIGDWQVCDAGTIKGAKRIATRRHSGRYIDETVYVGFREANKTDRYGVMYPIEVIASRPMTGKKWYDRAK